MTENNSEYDDLLNKCRSIADEIKVREDSESVILDFFVSAEEQKTMLEFGFVGDFITIVSPCEKVEKPYITHDQYLQSDLQDREHVQCPLHEKRCDNIIKETESGASPCELLYKKLAKLLG